MTDLYTYIHQYFNEQKRVSFPYKKKELEDITDSNGLYVLFEKGESFNGVDRIVRIGSHKGNNRLVKRLGDHFLSTKQRKSIFRKHIGRCFLNIVNDDYLDSWNKPFNKKVDKERYKDVVNLDYEKDYENRISDHISNNLSFTVIPKIYSKIMRDKIEEGLIAILAQSNERISSSAWLGNNHPDPRIGRAKLWNIQHVGGTKLTLQEFVEMVESNPLK
jgi:hypothetical protein